MLIIYVDPFHLNSFKRQQRKNSLKKILHSGIRATSNSIVYNWRAPHENSTNTCCGVLSYDFCALHN